MSRTQHRYTSRVRSNAVRYRTLQFISNSNPHTTRQRLFSHNRRNVTILRLPKVQLRNSSITIFRFSSQPTTLQLHNRSARNTRQPISMLIINIITRHRRNHTHLRARPFKNRRILFRPFRRVHHTLKFNRMFIQLLLSFRRTRIVGHINLPISKRRIRHLLPKFQGNPRPNRRRVTITVIRHTFTGINRRIRRLTIVLAVLFNRVTSGKIRFAPRRQFNSRAFEVRSNTRMPFTANRVFNKQHSRIIITSQCQGQQRLRGVTKRRRLRPTRQAFITTSSTTSPIGRIRRPHIRRKSLISSRSINFLRLTFTTYTGNFSRVINRYHNRTSTTPKVSNNTISVHNDSTHKYNSNRKYTINAHLPCRFIRRMNFTNAKHTHRRRTYTKARGHGHLKLPRCTAFFASPHPVRQGHRTADLSAALDAPYSAFSNTV